jgi:hypothetical protein
MGSGADLVGLVHAPVFVLGYDHTESGDVATGQSRC